MVGLGESTHGSHEQFEMKHRMVRFLVEELGYRTVGFENDFASGVLTSGPSTAGATVVCRSAGAVTCAAADAAGRTRRLAKASRRLSPG